jgi:hypothetical protein
MPATDSILSISLYVYSLVQSFILAYYMPVLYANNSISYPRLSICYCKQFAMSNSMPLYMSTCISATELELVCQLTYQVQYLLICQMLYPICYMLYAGCHMPRLICQSLYVECHVLAVASLQSYQFICLSQYQFMHALSQISHASYSILAFICRHMSA